MISNDKEKIVELLNSYIDGELSERKQNEVKRLIDHDPKVMSYINSLIKGKNLIASVEQASAPEGIEQAVRERIERKLILDEYDKSAKGLSGRRDHYFRKMAGVAAILVLFAFLSVIVFQIVSPSFDKTNSQSVALQELEPLMMADMEIAKTPDLYILTLNTVDTVRVTNFLDQSFEELELKNNIVKRAGYNSYSYEIACSAIQAERIMLELNKNWNSVANADLKFAPSGDQKNMVQISDVEAANILSLISAKTDKLRLQKAVRYAKAESDDKNIDPVMPRLTSSDYPRETSKTKLLLRIIVK